MLHSKYKMSVSYLPNSKGGNLEITNEIIVRGTPVYDTLMGLSSNLTGLATNINGTTASFSSTIYAGGNITTNGNLISNNAIYGGQNGFLIAPKNATVGILMYGDGSARITNTTQSTSTSTGAFTVLGGVGIAGNLYVGGSLQFSGAVTVGTPTLSTHATTKAYVDGISYLTVSSGLTKTGSNISIDSAQPGITSLGTLTSLGMIGDITLNRGANATGTTYSQIKVMTGNYGAIFSAGLTQSVSSCWKIENTYNGAVQPIISCDGGTPQIVFQQTADSSSITTGAVVFNGGVAVTKNLYVGGNVNCPTSPTVGAHLTNKTYVDGVSYLTAGTGLTKTGGTFSVNTSQVIQSIVAPASNFISLKPNSGNSSEFLLTSTAVILKKNDGANVIYFDMTNGSIIVDFPITSNSTIQGCTGAEFTQIGNINSVSISNASWANVGNMNQNVSTTSIPTFVSVSANIIGGTVSATTGTFTGAVSTGLLTAVGTSIHTISTTSATDALKVENLSASGFASIWLSSPSLQAYIGTGGSGVGAPYQNNLYMSTNVATNFIINSTLTTKFLNTTDSSSSTTGGTQVLGGLGVVKNVNVGGNIVATGTVTAASFNGLTVGSVSFNPNFTVSGATFTTPVDTSFYTKLGKVVQINVIYTCNGSTGGSGNQILIYLPILPAGIQFCNLTMTSSLENPAAGNISIVEIQPGVGPNGIAYIKQKDISTNTISNGNYGMPSGSTRTYMLQFSYIV